MSARTQSVVDPDTAVFKAADPVILIRCGELLRHLLNAVIQKIIQAAKRTDDPGRRPVVSAQQLQEFKIILLKFLYTGLRIAV